MAKARQTKLDEKLRELREEQKPGEVFTLERISDETGYTRERIRYIEKQALRKMHALLGDLAKKEGFDITNLAV
jgi:DNA-directed RNA polymerase sigma subunit (sigma70/sigma32)